MGHPEKGCIVAPGVAEFFVSDALAAVMLSHQIY